MGMYELMEGKEVNGRGVWRMAGGKKWFMYYGSKPGAFYGSIKEWVISDRADMEAGNYGGWMYVASTALTPDQVTETWWVYDDTNIWRDGTAWYDAPKVRARRA
jgi:hypothetical protein